MSVHLALQRAVEHGDAIRKAVGRSLHGATRQNLARVRRPVEVLAKEGRQLWILLLGVVEVQFVLFFICPVGKEEEEKNKKKKK